MNSARNVMHVAVCALFLMVNVSSAQAKAAPESFAPLVEVLTPAVVNIFTTQKVKQDAESGAELPEGALPPDQMEEFKEFMERFGGGMGGMPDEGMQQDMQSLGSGFVIDSAGYVVTNNHVVEGADEIKVRFQDKKEEYDVSRSFEFAATQSLQEAEAKLGEEMIRTLSDDIFNRIFSSWE